MVTEVVRRVHTARLGSRGSTERGTAAAEGVEGGRKGRGPPST